MQMTQPNPRNNRRQFYAACGLAIPLCASLAAAAEFPIGVNFSENAAYLLGAAESAGAPTFEQINWNNRGRWGNEGALSDNTGTPTAITLKWDATGLYQNDANETLGGNNRLMKGYLDSNGAAMAATFDGVFGASDDKPTLLVRGLDTWMLANGIVSYSVVIYSDGDDGTGNRASKVWLAKTLPDAPVGGDPGLGTDLTSRVDMVDNSNWGANPSFTKVPASGGPGNYLVFPGQTAGSFYLRVDEAGNLPARAPINAIQIIGTTVVNNADADGDGLPDAWESNYGLDPNDDGTENINNGPLGDPDTDDRTNAEEYNGGVNGTNPSNEDTDGDKLNDGGEFTEGTNPLNPDTDDDLLPDGWEVLYSFNPLEDGTVNVVDGPDGDPDADDLINVLEYERGTDPRDAFTDGDSLKDGVEDKSGFWGGEIATGTDPTKDDSDLDGIPDGDENPDLTYLAGVRTGSNPNLTDSDGDGANDRWEYLLGTDPSQASSSLTKVAVTNPSFEFPATAGFVQGVPDNWTKVNSPNLDDTFVESISSIGSTGGEGTQYVGLEETGLYIYQDTGVPFSANTTYLIDLGGGYRAGYASGVAEFGFFSSNSIGTDVPGYPGRMDLNAIPENSGNPDADGVINKIRDASSLLNVGSGSLGRPYSLVTGATPPNGNIVVYIRHAGGGRVMVDNLRIIAVPNSVDVDNDDLPDAWELANRLNPRDATLLEGADGDPDGDGSTNAEELAAGTNPDDNNDVPVVVGPAIVSAAFNGAAFEVAVANLVPAKTYTLARGADLSGFTPIGTTVTGLTAHTFSDGAPPTGKAFYRVQEVP